MMQEYVVWWCSPTRTGEFFIFNSLICNVIYKFSLLHLHAAVDNYMLSHLISLSVCVGAFGGRINTGY